MPITSMLSFMDVHGEHQRSAAASKAWLVILPLSPALASTLQTASGGEQSDRLLTGLAGGISYRWCSCKP